MIDYKTLCDTAICILKNGEEWLTDLNEENFPFTPEMYQSATWNKDGSVLTVGKDHFKFYGTMDSSKYGNDTTPYAELEKVMDIETLAQAIEMLKDADAVSIDTNCGSGVSTSFSVETDILDAIAQEIADMDEEEIDPDDLPVDILFGFQFEVEADEDIIEIRKEEAAMYMEDLDEYDDDEEPDDDIFRMPVELEAVVYNLPFMKDTSDRESVYGEFCCPCVTTNCESGDSDDDHISFTPLKLICGK